MKNTQTEHVFESQTLHSHHVGLFASGQTWAKGPVSLSETLWPDPFRGIPALLCALAAASELSPGNESPVATSDCKLVGKWKLDVH